MPPVVTLADRIDLADFRAYFQADAVIGEHGRREVELDAELLELDRDRTVCCETGIGNSPPAIKLAV